jgi:hypothetical protein
MTGNRAKSMYNFVENKPTPSRIGVVVPIRIQ